MTAPREVRASDIAAKPHLLWNAFIDLLAMSDYHELTSAQRGAHLVFWYESEVQNGGHCQYITNRGLAHLDELIDALASMGADCQAQLLREVQQRLAAGTRPTGKAEDQWADDVLEGIYERLDAAFADCSPSLAEVLQRHLDGHETDFVIRVGEGG